MCRCSFPATGVPQLLAREGAALVTPANVHQKIIMQRRGASCWCPAASPRCLNLVCYRLAICLYLAITKMIAKVEYLEVIRKLYDHISAEIVSFFFVSLELRTRKKSGARSLRGGGDELDKLKL